MRPSNADLISDYMRDLEIDILCAERDGLPDYAAKCRAELAKLMQTKTADIKIDQYGMPHA